jgi:hypothetical protein
MPSHLHEAFLLLFRNRPALAAELLREALHVDLPGYTDVRIDSADLTDIQPAEYRADMVILLLKDKPALGIVVEVQLSVDNNKLYAWPVYVTPLRARIRRPVCLLVVAAGEHVEHWASRPIALGGGNYFLPLVLGPSGVPEITDEGRAIADPELAVMSAMAHARDPNAEKVLRIAHVAQLASEKLDAERSTMYCDLILYALPEVTRAALIAMNPAKYEYQSEFAKQYYGRGKIEGRVDLVLRQLAKRYGALSDATKALVAGAADAELEGIADRVLTASTLEEALGAVVTRQLTVELAGAAAV